MGKISQFVKAGALLLTMAGCSSPNSGGKDAEMDRFISDLMERMTLQEKLGQLNLPAGNDLVSGAVKNSKMTEKERIDCISRVRKSLQSMNYKIRKLNRLLRYTTLMDSWYELRGKYYKPKSMYTISTECQKRWARKARGVMN